MENINASANNLEDRLTDILSQLEELSSFTKICSVAFENDEAFSLLDPDDVSQTFNAINAKISGTIKDVQNVLEKMS